MQNEEDDGFEIKSVPPPPPPPVKPPKTPAPKPQRITLDAKTGVITVNPASQLTAKQIVDLIHKRPAGSTNLGDPEIWGLMQKAIAVLKKDGEEAIRIRTITDSEARKASKAAAKSAPQGTRVAVFIPDWWSFMVTASQANEWEITTAELTEIARAPAQGSTVAPPPITQMTPDLNSGDVETVTLMPGQLGDPDSWQPFPASGLQLDKADGGITIRHTTWMPSPAQGDNAVQDGAKRRKAGRSRGLIVVVNRVTCKKVTANAVCIMQGLFTIDDFVPILFHETGVHAGALSDGQPAGHGKPGVNQRADDIKAFLGSTTW